MSSLDLFSYECHLIHRTTKKKTITITTTTASLSTLDNIKISLLVRLPADSLVVLSHNVIALKIQQKKTLKSKNNESTIQLDILRAGRRLENGKIIKIKNKIHHPSISSIKKIKNNRQITGKV